MSYKKLEATREISISQNKKDSLPDDTKDNAPDIDNSAPKISMSITSTSVNDEYLNTLFINDIDIESEEQDSNIDDNNSKAKCNFFCTLMNRRDFVTLSSPIILLILLIIIIEVNINLIIVWLLSILSFYMLLVFSYFYVFDNDSYPLLDQFTLSMYYGYFMAQFIWLFSYLLCVTDNILIGPFIFEHSYLPLNSTTNTVLYSFIACIVYGGIGPFITIYLKCDNRICDHLKMHMCNIRCLLTNINLLNEYQHEQQSVNVSKNEMEQIINENEQNVIHLLSISMKRLRMECIATLMGYFGGMYMTSFLLRFNLMNITSTTLIFVFGYLLKDLLFIILIGIIYSYIIGKEKIYKITINIKYLYYSLVMFLGIIQTCPATILCDLYPHATIRFTIIGISVGINVIILIACFVEVLHQKKLLKEQLNALFISNQINSVNIDNDGYVDNVQMELSLN